MSMLPDQILRKDDNSSQVVAAMMAMPLRRTCSSFSTVTEAVLLFKDEDCGMLPVVDEGKLVGTVSDRDVALAVVDVPELAEQPVSRIMNRAVTTVLNKAPVDEVIRSMITSNTQSIFMVDESGRLGGLISWADLTARIPLGAMIDVLEPASAKRE